MSSITFGRYTPYKTVVHKLDPRVKLFATIVLTVIIFLPFQLWSTRLVMSGLYLLGLIILMIISKVSIGQMFKSLKGIWFMALFLFIVYIFIPNPSYSGAVAFKIGSYNIYWMAFYQAAYIILRIIMMLCIMMVLTTTTKPMELTFGIEWYMTPLKLIKFPVNEIAMTISIALRFIPTLLDESERIMKAQESRGAGFKNNGFKKFGSMISLIVPLFVSAFQRSEELANALEARSYDPRAKRTRYRVYKFRLIDALGIILTLLLLGLIIFMMVYESKNGAINLIQLIFKVDPKF